MKYLLLLSLIATTACMGKKAVDITIRGGGGGKAGASVAPAAKITASAGGSTVDSKTFKNPQEATQALAATKVFCEDEATCSPSIAAFLQKDGNALRRCTSFAIGEDEMAVSGHCVADTNSNGILFRFPQTSKFPSQDVVGKKVLRSSKELKGKFDSKIEAGYLPDYAVIQLAEKLKRPALEFSAEAHENNQQVVIQKIEFGEGDTYSHLHTQQCQVSTKSTGLYTNLSTGPVIRLKNCEGHHGNSGAPVFNANSGKVIGMLKGALDKYDPKHMKSIESLKMKNVNSFVMADSAACLMKDLSGCLYDEKASVDAQDKLLNDKASEIKALIKTEQDKYTAQNSQALHWKVKADSQSSTLIPECAIEKSKKPTEQFDMGWWIINKELNADFEDTQTYRNETVKARLNYSAGAEATLSYRNPVTNSFVTEKIQLPVCGKAP